MNLFFISFGLVISALPWQLPENTLPWRALLPNRLKKLKIRYLADLPKALLLKVYPPKIRLNLVIQEIISRLEGGQPTRIAIRDSFCHHLKNIDKKLSCGSLEKHLNNPELSGLAAMNAAITYSRILGTPIVEVLKDTAASITDMLQIKNRQEIAISGPRISARILVFLPLVGIGFGKLLGAKPIASFSDGKLGSLTLFAGIFLWLMGWLWWRKILSRAREAATL